LGGPYQQDFVESVRSAADIVRLVSDYVPLRQAGRRHKGLCPFHQEKTPSFSVDAERQLFYCFGCQTGGDVFRFVQLYEKLEFREALEFLAGRFGVPIPERSGGPSADDPVALTLAMNRAALDYYRKLLADPEAGARARAYLERRGIDADVVERLQLGYAADGWEGLRGHLLSKRFAPAALVRGGLVRQREGGSGQYDRFRDRLIFPIRDTQGRVVAFGGRALSDDDEPKYLNSPETPAYVKGNHLYGLDQAREAIRQEGLAIIVEGYMDLAAVLQAGRHNVVASLGTAFTPAQARLLARFTQRVVVSYDGDAAGNQATLRSLDLLLEHGMEVRVVELPPGMDPDDYIRAHDPAAYARLVHEAPQYIHYMIRRVARARDIAKVEEKVAAVNAVLPHIAKLSNAIERAGWATRLADELQIEEGLVMQELRKALRAAQKTIRQRPDRPNPLRESDARLVSRLLASDDDRRHCAAAIEWRDLEGSPVIGIVRKILEIDERGDAVEYSSVWNELDEADRGLLTAIAFRDEPAEGPTAEDCLLAFRRQRLTREGRQALRELDRVRSGADDPPRGSPPASVDEQLRRIEELARQRDRLM
jgi:DNA primase